MNNSEKRHGGARPGAGRKRDEPRQKVCITLSKDEHALLKELGGSAWVRKQLELQKIAGKKQ